MEESKSTSENDTSSKSSFRLHHHEQIQERMRDNTKSE